MESVMQENSYGSGYGSGFGYGSGYGSGYGYGSGSGSGYGSGYGDGSGSGYGDGDGSGYGYGDGYGEIEIPKESAWECYHFIRRSVVVDDFILRTGAPINIGDHLHEDGIELCKRGLHASLSARDAKKYAPPESVLTKVKVWGRIIVDKDKLVATDRQIVEVLRDTES
jgi:hypothetical protein